MKKNLRKTISLLLCLLMLGGVMPLAMLGASAGEGNNTIDPSLRATGNETYTDLIGQTTSAGQHGTVKTPAMLDTEHPGGWLYLYGETYELPVGATLGSDRESRIVPTDGYVLPDRYVIVKIGYASSSRFLTGMPLLWLAHSYDFFDNISATALSGQQIANNAESGASDMSSWRTAY